jgi:O6-methylguanine-DNA--protein-cysteine methyltransferase
MGTNTALLKGVSTMPIRVGSVCSEAGTVLYAVSEKGALAITTPGQSDKELEVILRKRGYTLEECEPDAEGLHDVGRQLTEYMDGRRSNFSFPLDYEGTPFQAAVWEALQQIPYGQTVTYGDIALAIGRPKASRAVGQANHVNPLALVIP